MAKVNIEWDMLLVALEFNGESSWFLDMETGEMLLVSEFGDDDDEIETATGATGPQIVSPQERVARSIEESRTTSTADITLKTEPGTSAEVTDGKLGGGLQLQSSGAF